LVYGAAIVFEVALGLCSLLGLAAWWRTVGPYAQFGMAARHEVVAVLGHKQLIRRRKTIRPDLIGGRRR
jgi:hypothetical protein